MRFESAPELPGFLQPHLPFDRRMMVIGTERDKGRRIHFVDHGAEDAQPVFMIHGNPTWSFLWRKVIQKLDPTKYRVIAPDLLGFGFSSKLPSPGDHYLERHIGAMALLFDELDLTDAILVGQDWGGPMCTGVGSRFPSRVSGVVLGNTSVLMPKEVKATWFHEFSQLPLVSDVVFRLLGFPQNILKFAQGDRSSISGEVAKAYRVPFRSWSDCAGPLGLARMVPHRSRHPSIPFIRQGEAWIRSFDGPIALVWGKKDPILGRALKKHEKVLDTVRVVKTGAGHFLQEEVPEELASAIEYVATKARETSDSQRQPESAPTS